MPETPSTSAACCPVHALGKCDAVFTCCDRCPTFFGPEGDCTPEEAVEAVKAVRASAAPPHEWDGDIVRCQQCEQRMSVQRFFHAEAHACWARPSMTITEALDAE